MASKQQGKLAEEQIQEAKEAFNIFDKDGDGHLTKSELKGVMKNLGLSVNERDMDKLMVRLDLDKNGTVEFEEFLVLLGDRSIDSSEEEEMRKAFRVFDDDDSGEIVIGELKETFRKLGQNITQEELNDIVSEVDDDGDGKISFEEFVHIMTYK